ncbi:MAG: hypothetical protein QNJ60_01780 [Xenococcaceae cyanobacterium MO_188.B19]|nr:hypothetical protein [Xenococcaceae cyanobacterium MO_188.B19]
MISNPTLFDFYTDKKFANNTEKFNCVQTAILRYFLTAVTGKRLKNERFNQEQINKQVKKLKRIEVDSSFDIETHLELIKKGGEMYGKTKTQMKSHVSYGKRFFEYVSKCVVTPEQKEIQDNKNSILSYREAIMDKSEFYTKSRVENKRIILINDPELYLSELREKYPKLSSQKIYDKARLSLSHIFKTIEDFIKYRSQGSKKCRKTTYYRDKEAILRFIGWYKEYYKLSIDKVDIKSIFPIISPYQYFKEYDLSCLSKDNFAELAKEEWVLKVQIKNESREFKKVLDNFFCQYLINSKLGTKQVYVQSLINFSYFLYKDITDTEENDDFQDISLIRTLRVYMRNLGNQKEIEEKKVIPFIWSEIIAVYERLRKEANQDYTYSKSNKNNKGRKLTKREKSLHIQDFLAIAFFCIMPPDRQRTFRELTFGETLKYGIRDPKRNIFISYDKLESDEEPKYYIHLLPHQYKTGSTYGTYWYEIDNVKYEDGKKFYDYLNQWLFDGYRDELATTGKTDAIFIRTKTGKRYEITDSDEDDYSTNIFYRFIENIFLRKTKFPLNPHALRDIYVTHINNLNLPEETRRAIAYMMHHDIDTANKTYNRQTMDEKISLGVDFVRQSHNKKLAV